MSLLRRALGRNELIAGVLLVLLGGGWLGWHWLLQPGLAQVDTSMELDYQMAAVIPELLDTKALLDAGKYEEVIRQVEAAKAMGASSAGSLAKQAVAYMYVYNGSAALVACDNALAAGAQGVDAAMAEAVRALVWLGPEHLRVQEAKQSAQHSLQAAGADAEGLLLARVALAAALRSELDPPLAMQSVADQVAQIKEVLEPVCSEQAPQTAWGNLLWRRGLATLVDAGVLAGDASDETQALATLRQKCPQDAWACYFSIPEKAVVAAQSGVEPIDDHARVAMYTAAGFLYAQSGDRLHCDTLLRKGIVAYGRLLEEYDGWDGSPKTIVTPQGVVKTVGSEEFHDYRNRMERQAKYCADWWGMRVVQGDVTLDAALQACDHKLFRAIVRVRADRQTNPIQIMLDEHIRQVDYLTVADWFLTRAYALQLDWETARGQLLKKIGEEECQAHQAFQEAGEQSGNGKYEEALLTLAKQLQVEPSIAETGITVRCQMASQLIKMQRVDECLAVLDAAEAVMNNGDLYLGRYADYLLGDIHLYRGAALWLHGDIEGAIEENDFVANNEQSSPSLKMLAMARLVDLHVRQGSLTEAQAAYGRLAELPDCEPPILEFAAACLRRAGSP